MRILTLIIPASMLLSAATSAQTLPYPRDSPSVSTEAIKDPGRRWIRPDEARQIGGGYDMSNGWSLEVATYPRYIDVRIDDQPPIRLVSVARYKFVSVGGNIQMAFNLGNWGDEMELRYVPEPPAAGLVVLSARTAQD
jgi:hypothetical protein